MVWPWWLHGGIYTSPKKHGWNIGFNQSTITVISIVPYILTMIYVHSQIFFRVGNVVGILPYILIMNRRFNLRVQMHNNFAEVYLSRTLYKDTIV